MSITMVHLNPLVIEHERLRVDRKFHVGMQNYAAHIGHRITTVNPVLRRGSPIMDAIEIPLAELPYDVLAVETDSMNRPLPLEAARLREQIARSSLVYGSGLSTERLTRELGVPYIMVLEYDLQTQMIAASCALPSRLRRAVRSARCAWRHVQDELPQVRRAHSIHCNGYPIYNALRAHNGSRLLYLDSRMSKSMVLAREALADRLAGRTNRPLRLLYSGRYERLKGADDAARVAVECLRRGLDIEMHFYGQGSLRQEMENIARTAVRADRIHIHDAVPFPTLSQISRSFDLFVCCHIQNDPSCTYLESFGAGLPVVGYANRMWRGLCEASGAGLATPLGKPAKVAEAIERLLRDPQRLDEMSNRAVNFAHEHCFESEFGKRVAAINAAIGATATDSGVEPLAESEPEFEVS